MRDVFRTGAAVRSARATRRDLLLETLALRQQLGVLARSNRRFRPSDRLLWLFLRWLWPRWREALVLVQPATVDRWHREGLRRCWRRRSRRPGRPCIDSPCRYLIRRLAAENCLWGAPRIHGELLKLGIAISERTGSRYLRGRPTTRSQTWRTFSANHLGNSRFISPVMFADARGDDGVVDASDLLSRPVPSSIDGSCASIHWASVDWRRSLQYASLGVRLAQDHLQNRPGARKSLQCLGDRRQCETIRPRDFAMAVSDSPLLCNRVVSVVGRPNISFGPRRVCVRGDSHGRRNIGDAHYDDAPAHRQRVVFSRAVESGSVSPSSVEVIMHPRSCLSAVLQLILFA